MDDIHRLCGSRCKNSNPATDAEADDINKQDELSYTKHQIGHQITQIQ